MQRCGDFLIAHSQLDAIQHFNFARGERGVGRALIKAGLNPGVVLVPSRWEEPCPYAALDAQAAGVPTLVSDRGGLPELVGEGEPLNPDDRGSWGSALGALWSDPAVRRQRGEASLARARERFHPDRYYEALMGVYRGGAG